VKLGTELIKKQLSAKLEEIVGLAGVLEFEALQ
jgi:hypothetical protein